MPFLIERNDGGSRKVLSMKLGRDFGHPGGAFTSEADAATIFATREAAMRAVRNLGPMSSEAQCEVREIRTKPLPTNLGGFPSGFVADSSSKL